MMPEVTEVCPSCESEITMVWDVDQNGFKAFCPKCGSVLMLCDACQHRVDGCKYVGDCDYNSKSNTCRFNLKHYAVTVEETYVKSLDIYAHNADEAEVLARYLNKHGNLDNVDMVCDNVNYSMSNDPQLYNKSKNCVFDANDYEEELRNEN